MVKILITLINDHLRRENLRKFRPRSYFYVSEAGKTAFEIYKRLTFIQENPPKTRLLMKIGKMTHRRVYRHLERIKIMEASEVPLGDDLFRGYADALIKIPDEESMVLEIKTVSTKEFNRVARRDRPPWESYIQLQLYLHYLNKERGRILYIESNALRDYVLPLESFRAEQRMKEFIVTKNLRVIGYTLKKFGRLREVFVKGGVMMG